MKEIWKDIKGYEGFYQISNSGRIKSLSRQRKIFGNREWESKEKILKLQKNHKGYLAIILHLNNKTKSYPVHRLVLNTFVGESDLQCNHMNGIKIDNRLENLEWCTPSENKLHAFRIGLIDYKGENHPGHKLTGKQVKQIKIYDKKNKPGRGYWTKVALQLGVSYKCIAHIITNRSWKHIQI